MTNPICHFDSCLKMINVFLISNKFFSVVNSNQKHFMKLKDSRYDFCRRVDWLICASSMVIILCLHRNINMRDSGRLSVTQCMVGYCLTSWEIINLLESSLLYFESSSFGFSTPIKKWDPYHKLVTEVGVLFLGLSS